MPRPSTITKNDEDVLEVLERAERPLSAYDILAELKSTSIKAPNQVYRALDKLTRHGQVHRIEALNAFVACHHAHASRPGFVVCRDCGKVRELEDERLAAIADAVGRSGFAIDSVSLEILGHCARCSKSGGKPA
ncbi:MAG: Fur family transcriptional regulator [Hyphomicrobiaceae bacterium]